MIDLSKQLHTIYRFLLDYGFSESVAMGGNLAINLLLLLVLLVIIDKLLVRFIKRLFFAFSSRTKTRFDNYLFKSNFPKYISRLFPLFLFYILSGAIFERYPILTKQAFKTQEVLFIILIILIVRSIIRSIKNYLKDLDGFKDKPLDSFSQVFIITFWIIGIIFIISTVIDQSIIKLLAGLGALSAIIILVFKDTILGFVASIQVSMYDIVRIGDWITVEKFGADGTVIELNLTTVKIQNFDNTISTLPTYSLISESFKNWRGMTSSRGRRIKRCLYIKQESVKFLSSSDLENLSKIQMLSGYISHRQKDIDDYNKKNEFKNDELKVNGRNQTNLGLFRKYCDLYLERHSAVHKEMIIMTRHLQPTPYGIPIEIYCFSKDKEWLNYERIMADILEHIVASVNAFDLKIFEVNGEINPTIIG